LQGVLDVCGYKIYYWYLGKTFTQETILKDGTNR
jgi:hypothetical protein